MFGYWTDAKSVSLNIVTHSLQNLVAWLPDFPFC